MNLVAVVLAAGLGTRLRPLTSLRPKALCPVGDATLLDRALASVAGHADAVAVNAHHLAGQVVAHLAGRDVHVSVEPALLGTAGALGRLRDWVDGRPVLVRNADAYLPGGIGALLDGWDGARPRLLVTDAGAPADFGTARYVGACLLPAADAARLPDTPSGLHALVWLPAQAYGRLELVATAGYVADCGTPRDYLRANLHASGGRSVVGAGAQVLGTVERCVVWPGAYVGPDEHLVDCVRAGRDVTVRAG